MLKISPPPSALVISPFASHPRDAGHRRRVWQMTNLLAVSGYRVTFLLFAFEDGWAWRHDERAAAAMRDEWDELIVVHAGQHVGRPPANGSRHGLDEWWDPSLQAAVANLSTRRCFDIVVVHNVWLSKAFDFVHPASVKVLETHDLFHKREAAFAAIGRTPSFFRIDREAEAFGLSRADILVAIQAADARELLDISNRRVVNVPFYDASLETEPEAPRLLDPEITSFGMLASANPFNAHGLAALIEAIETEVAENFAPIELVVGGGVGAAVSAKFPVRRLGFVASEAEFYAGVDYAIAPVFAGTGFKIKTGDALALGGPLLASAHAAEGTTIDKTLVFDTPRAMAARMGEIALRRPNPGPAQNHVARARRSLRNASETGAQSLLRAIVRQRRTLVVDLRDAGIEHSALKLQGWIGMARELAGHPTILIVPDAVRELIERVLPPGLRAMSLAAFEVNADHFPVRATIDATDAGARGDRDFRDDRWTFSPSRLGSWEERRRGEEENPFATMPLLHPNVSWEPAAQRLRAAWGDTAAARNATFAPGPLLLRPMPSAVRAADGRFVDSDNPMEVNAALMRLLHEPPALTVVVSGAAHPWVRRAALEVCAIARIPYRGLADDAALAPARLPEPVGRELAALARAAAARFISLPRFAS